MSDPAYGHRAERARLPMWAVALIALGMAIVGGFGALLAGAFTQGYHDGQQLAQAAAPAVAPAHRPADDVTMAKCITDADGYPLAYVGVRNSGTDEASYYVTVAFDSLDGATHFGSGTAVVQAIASGQSATAQVLTGDTMPDQPLHCRIADVTRTP